MILLSTLCAILDSIKGIHHFKYAYRSVTLHDSGFAPIVRAARASLPLDHILPIAPPAPS
ncbi:unnamed protein product [Periconia digitata]|uniref:Uncharacterized protein n=1 Tax=Periconia digitata TaxID=1303443 RepID=A0A9W4U4J4_9PLEO|nr:unnamed protein product [Periconia digitata]